MAASYFIYPQLFEIPRAHGGFGASITMAGVYFLPATIISFAAGPFAGRMAHRFGSRGPFVVGTLIAAASYGLLAFCHSEVWQILLASGLLGLGMGLNFATMGTLMVEAVPREQMGIATGMNSILRNIGGACGVQVTASIVAGFAVAGTATVHGLGVGAGVIGGAILIGFFVALAVPASDSRHRRA